MRHRRSPPRLRAWFEIVPARYGFVPATRPQCPNRAPLELVFTHDGSRPSTRIAPCSRHQPPAIPGDRELVLALCDLVECLIRIQHARGHRARDQRAAVCSLGCARAAARAVAAPSSSVVLGVAARAMAAAMGGRTVANHAWNGVRRNGISCHAGVAGSAERSRWSWTHDGSHGRLF